MNSIVRVPVEHSEQPVSISVKVEKRGDDDLAVFMHGFGCAKETFGGAFDSPYLRDFSLCTFDFPSHGDSGQLSQRPATLEVFASIARSLVSTFAAPRVYLICHSMGGAVGVLAAQGMAGLAGFMSVEGNLVAQDCGIVSRSTASQAQSEFVAQGFHDFGSDLSNSPRNDLLAWSRWYRACEPGGLHQIARSLVKWSDSGDLLTMFQRLTPRAYVYGADSEVDYVRHMISDTQFYRIESSGHFPMLDNPGSFYAVVARFLDQARVGRSLSVTSDLQHSRR